MFEYGKCFIEDKFTDTCMVNFILFELNLLCLWVYLLEVWMRKCSIEDKLTNISMVNFILYEVNLLCIRVNFLEVWIGKMFYRR